MINELFTAIALLLVIEGIMPFLSPRTLRRALFQIVQHNDRVLRWTGFATMVAGVALLYLVRH